MAKEYKAQAWGVKSTEGRTVKGVFAVFGNRDSYGDRIHPGAFTKTIAEQAGRVRHLWNHDFSNPPIATVKSLRQLSRSELPESVLTTAPDATGGVEVVREYLSNPLAEWVFEALKAGAINEMSFAFEVPKDKADLVEERGADGEKLLTRQIHELRLYETSDVLWGANPATAAVRSLPLEALADGLKALAAEIKAGRRNSTKDATLLQTIHDHTAALGAMCGDQQEEKAADPQPATISSELQTAAARLRLIEVFGF